MAKQNVNSVERHLEKAVCAVVGLVLLGVLFVYGINTPYTIEVAGEKVGAKDFYKKIGEQADSVKSQMKNASPDQGIDRPEIPNLDETLKLVTEMPIPFALMNPKLPETESVRVAGKIKLTEVLAPMKPLLTTSRAFARLPEQTVLNVVRMEKIADPPLGITQDRHWVTIFSVIDRKKQRDQFIQADYGLDKLTLAVVGVEVERQVRLPDGNWQTPGEIISPYAPIVFDSQLRQVAVEDDDGRRFVSDQDWAYVEALDKAVATADAQSRILRPSFQEHLEDPLDWSVPVDKFDEGINLADYGIVLPAGEQDKVTEKPGLSRGGRTSARDLRNQSKADLKAAQEAYAEENYEEAKSLLESVLANAETPDKEETQAKSLLNEVIPKLELAEKREAQAAETKEDEKYLGVPLEVFWVSDTAVEPGRTYRYRVRVLSLNQYAGNIPKLENPDDAGRVIIEGEWSEWSDAITVKPNKYLWFLGPGTASASARVEMRQWSNGMWKPGTGEIKVGEQVAFSWHSNDFTYDAVVADIEDNRPYSERIEGRGGADVRYGDEGATSVLTLVNSRGETQELIAAQDAAEKRKVLAAIKEEEKERASRKVSDNRAKGKSPLGRQPSVRQPRDGVTPRGRFSN